MAMEELSGVAYGVTGDDEIAINIYGASTARVALTDAGVVEIEQRTAYPHDERVLIRVSPEQESNFCLRLRIPEWAADARIAINVEATDTICSPGTYVSLRRLWRAGDEVTLTLPMPLVMHRRSNINVQESRAPDGSAVQQQVLKQDYFAVTRGPLVYATDLIDGFKTEESMRLPRADPDQWLRLVPTEAAGNEASDDDSTPSIELSFGYRAPITLHPYYLAGGRHDRRWRLTWLSLAPGTEPSSTDDDSE